MPGWDVTSGAPAHDAGSLARSDFRLFANTTMLGVIGSFCVQATAGGIQRWRDRDPDHDHGARVAHPGWYFMARLGTRIARGPRLRAQLRLPRDLLAQPPSHAGGRLAGQRGGAVGQPQPALP